MHRSAVDVCIIEDDACQRKLLTRQLEQSKLTVVEAEDAESGLQAVYQHRPRVVVCDVMLPHADGIDVCRKIRSDPSLDSTFLILITACREEVRMHSALEIGADDYLHKPFDVDQLRARIRSGLRYHRLQERLHRAAITDGLTGLWNHGYFRDLLEREFVRTQRYGGTVSLLMLDIDHFKAINDTFGHEAGNVVLKLAARELERSIRETDLVARYGGEEFAVICPETTVKDAEALAERIRLAFSQQIHVAEHPQLVVRASIGVASTEDSRVASVNDLVNLADQALYCSKRAGRNRVTSCRQPLVVESSRESEFDDSDRLQKEVVNLRMQMKELCMRSVSALIQALEARDGYSAWHSRNVTLYAKWLAEEAGLPRPMRMVIANAAMLHDLGKIGVPDHLLMKPRPLDLRESRLMQQVPLLTCRILEPLRVFENEVAMIRHLRERFDGAGYPDGLKGTQIPTGSRVLAIAEAFDSITCNRAYRMGKSLVEAVALLRAESGGQFDPALVELLYNCTQKNPMRWENQIKKARVEMPNECATAAIAGY